MEKRGEKFSWRKRAKAFGYAWQGFVTLVREEHNARIHVVAAALVMTAGFLFGISAAEWMAVVICIAAVMSAEALNSAVEALADRLSPQYDPLVGKAKDYGAFAVTALALASVAVGAIIFIPRIIGLLQNL